MLLFHFCRNKDVDFCLEVDQIREQLGPHVSVQSNRARESSNQSRPVYDSDSVFFMSETKLRPTQF